MIHAKHAMEKVHAKTQEYANPHQIIQTKTKDLIVNVKIHFMESIVKDGVGFEKFLYIIEESF